MEGSWKAQGQDMCFYWRFALALLKISQVAVLSENGNFGIILHPLPMGESDSNMKTVAKTLALAFAALLAGCASIRTGENTDGFVMLAEAVPDAILEPRYYSTYNFIGDRVDGYEEPCALLSKEAAKSLKAASDEAVRRGYRLKIYDAYRPQRAVAHFVRWSKDTSTRILTFQLNDNNGLLKKGEATNA